MFDKDARKLVTAGVNNLINSWFQGYLWFLIDDMVIAKDYLQVFELSITKGDIDNVITVIHTQEHPNYEETCFHQIPTELQIPECLENNNKLKIWCIDDQEYQTMLLPEEY